MDAGSPGRVLVGKGHQRFGTGAAAEVEELGSVAAAVEVGAKVVDASRSSPPRRRLKDAYLASARSFRVWAGVHRGQTHLAIADEVVRKVQRSTVHPEH